jgi:hypothetical protein
MKSTRKAHVVGVETERLGGPIRHTVNLSCGGWEGDNITMRIIGALPEGILRDLQGKSTDITVTYDFGEYDAEKD